MSNARTWRFRVARMVALPAVAALALGTLATTTAAQAATSANRPVPGTKPAWTSSAKDLGAAPASASLATHVYLAGDAAGLAAYASSVSDPTSANYQHFLTPAQLNSRFGATTSQVRSVEGWLRSDGLHAAQVSPHEIDVTGSTAQAEKAYGTRLRDYRSASGTFRAPASNAQVPASVAGAVLSIDGLDGKPVLEHPASLATQTGVVRPALTNARLPMSKGADGSTFLGPTPCSSYYGQKIDTTDPKFNGAHQPYAICGYTPAQLRGAYHVNGSRAGRGVTVAVTDAYASSTIGSDASTYATNHGDQAFAPGQLTQTTTPADWTDEAACGGPASWAPEETLDVEAVHAMAPGADIHYYGANSCEDAGFLAVLTSIIDQHSADVITNSWGEVISANPASDDEPAPNIAEFTQLFEQAAAEGIEVSFSAGDCGADVATTSCGEAAESAQAQAAFPSSDPYVTSVGGNSVEIGAHDNFERALPWGTDAWVLQDKAWQAAGWIYGGGGGTSGPSINGTFPGFSQPFYQRGVVPTSLAESLPNGATTSTPMRVTPDVSMDADPYTGFLIGETQKLPNGSTGYAESDIGGTSLATPLFAGMVADGVADQQLGRGFVNPALYLDDTAFGRQAFSDVVDPAASNTPYEISAPYAGSSAVAVLLGDDQVLKATPGYDDATGVGTPAMTPLASAPFTTTPLASAAARRHHWHRRPEESRLGSR